jgi:hypothetical protein
MKLSNPTTTTKGEDTKQMNLSQLIDLLREISKLPGSSRARICAKLYDILA